MMVPPRSLLKALKVSRSDFDNPPAAAFNLDVAEVGPSMPEQSYQTLKFRPAHANPQC